MFFLAAFFFFGVCILSKEKKSALKWREIYISYFTILIAKSIEMSWAGFCSYLLTYSVCENAIGLILRSRKNFSAHVKHHLMHNCLCKKIALLQWKLTVVFARSHIYIGWKRSHRSTWWDIYYDGRKNFSRTEPLSFLHSIGSATHWCFVHTKCKNRFQISTGSFSTLKVQRLEDTTLFVVLPVAFVAIIVLN